MSAKEELKAIRKLDWNIQCDIERCECWFDAATRGTGSMEAERVSGTGDRSRVESMVCAIVDFERDKGITAQIDKLADMRQAAEWIIARIENPAYRQVLRLRYLQHKSWRWSWGRIAKEMGLHQRRLYELHGHALLAYTVQMPQKR